MHIRGAAPRPEHGIPTGPRATGNPCDQNLGTHEVQASDHLGHRMFHLNLGFISMKVPALLVDVEKNSIVPALSKRISFAIRTAAAQRSWITWSGIP